ncbi:hypothetical protein [Pseudoclavibacter sp. AY1H1]|uniref:hypothetical protein n=1 Tax=Pseudoclavibacter sp. AY1H1 TaxID=2080584 RepID=UPI0011B0AC4E|nr:hypothetical protein [Pseudoclavibacter sp. AY1H1]
MGDTSAARRVPGAPPRRARTITIVAIVTVLLLAAGWVVLAFTDESDTSPTDAVSESTLPGYPTRGPRADLDDRACGRRRPLAGGRRRRRDRQRRRDGQE